MTLFPFQEKAYPPPLRTKREVFPLHATATVIPNVARKLTGSEETLTQRGNLHAVRKPTRSKQPQARSISIHFIVSVFRFLAVLGMTWFSIKMNQISRCARNRSRVTVFSQDFMVKSTLTIYLMKESL